MSDDELRAAALYRTMSTAHLVNLKLAFEADMSRASGCDTIEFAAGRIALIEAELARRHPATG